MDREACGSLVKEAMRMRAFPPTIRYTAIEGHQLVELFAVPTVAWVPEASLPGLKPLCINEACVCVSSVKEYMWREVNDVYHTTFNSM